MRKLLASLTVMGLLFLPFSALAATTHSYVCSEITLGGGGSCTGGSSSLSLVIPNSGNVSAFDAVPLINIYGASWYVTIVVTAGASGTGKIDCTGSCGSASNNTFTGSVTDQLVPFTVGGGPTSGIDITNNGNSFSGTLTYLCVSDTAGQCVPPSPSAAAPFLQFFNLWGWW